MNSVLTNNKTWLCERLTIPRLSHHPCHNPHFPDWVQGETTGPTWHTTVTKRQCRCFSPLSQGPQCPQRHTHITQTPPPLCHLSDTRERNWSCSEESFFSDVSLTSDVMFQVQPTWRSDVRCVKLRCTDLRWEPWHQGDRTPQTCHPGARSFFFLAGLHFFEKKTKTNFVFSLFFLSLSLFLCTHSLGSF